MIYETLQIFFSPQSIALIGASPKEGALGKVLMENIIRGGYAGTLFPVNPKYSSIFGMDSFSSVKMIPSIPDLGIICTPASIVPSLITELGERGTKAAVVISAGFGEEAGGEGKALQAQMLEAARIYGVRIVGPNCLGIINPKVHFNATFSPLVPQKGKIGFVSQSGALLVSLLEWAEAKKVGFSKLISVGGLSDLNFGNYLEYLREDPETKVILLYVEAITEASQFLAIAKETVIKKPVIILKSGRAQGAAKAVQSHSGALAGSDAVYEAAFRESGLCRLYELQDVFDLLLLMNLILELKGEDLTILTNGGGLGILATDALLAFGGKLSSLSDETLSKLNAVLPVTWSQGNPVDIIGDAPPERFAATLNILMDDPELHSILLMHCPTSLSPAQAVLNGILEEIHKRQKERPQIFLAAPQQNFSQETLMKFFQNKIPIFLTPERAVRAYRHLQNIQKDREFIDRSQKKEIPVDPNVAQLLQDLVAKEEKEWLDHHIIQKIFTAYHIPVIRTEFAASPEEAKILSQEMAFPLVLKVVSKDIVHKSDVGGVVLNVNSPEDVEKKAQNMLKVISSQDPHLRIDGFLLQPMIPLDHGFELFLGGIQDPTFGPVVIFGAGGKAVEVVQDKALALAPLTHKSTEDLMAQTRIYAQLKGYRDQKPVVFDQLIACLTNLSYLLQNHPEIKELDINPLRADSKRIIVLDSRMRLTCSDELIESKGCRDRNI